jgi:preprotein translocase subunit YajC
LEFVALYFIVLVLLVVFIIVVPSRKRRIRHQELLKAITPGDTVVTIGGIVATVVAREENTFILRLNEDNNSHMRVLVSAIQGATQRG